MKTSPECTVILFHEFTWQSIPLVAVNLEFTPYQESGEDYPQTLASVDWESLILASDPTGQDLSDILDKSVLSQIRKQLVQYFDRGA